MPGPARVFVQAAVAEHARGPCLVPVFACRERRPQVMLRTIALDGTTVGRLGARCSDDLMSSLT